MQRLNPLRFRFCSRSETTTPQQERLSFYLHDHASSFRLELRGRLTSRDLVELEGCWATAVSSIGSRTICLDLRRLIDADDAGREWLHSMCTSEGVQVVAEQAIAASLGLKISAHSCEGQSKSRKAEAGFKLAQKQTPERKPAAVTKAQALPVNGNQTSIVAP